MDFRRRDKKRFPLRKECGAALILSAALFLAACGEETGQAMNGPHMAVRQSMEEAPILDYVVPRQLPGILTDRRGYCAGDLKRAGILGRQLPETFSLVDAKTGEIVYSGPVEQTGYDQERRLYRGKADFSQVGKQGAYYLKCDILGESYQFEIRELYYQELFQEEYEKLLKGCEDNSLSLEEAVWLLETYECYSGLFPDRNRNETPDVLEKLQGWISRMEEKNGWAGQESLYAAFLAKFSYNYKKFDYQYATDCLKRAATVFSQAPAAAEKNADTFFALTELHRASNLNTYRSQIAEYKKLLTGSGVCPEDTGYLYGRMTYLMTRQNVDAELCATFMEQIRSRGEEIARKYRDMDSLSEEEGSLLKNALELSCANYILNNYQYTNVIQDFLHYLMGRNREAVSFYEDSEDGGQYLLLSAQMAVIHEKNAEKK